MTTRTPEELEEKLHYHFKNKELLITALTHSSYANESKTPTLYNERLEFLGDSVLSVVVQINTRKKYAEVTNSIARKGQGRGLRPVSFSLAKSRGRASGASPHSIYTMISERTEAVNSRRRTTRTPSSRTRPKRMTVPSTVYSTTPY